MKHIVVGTDGSETALEALTWAAGDAALHRRPLDVVYCWPSWVAGSDGFAYQPAVQAGWETHAQDLVDAAVAHARETAPEIEVTGVTLGGTSPVDGLISVAANAEVLVLGTRGHGLVKELLLGSVTRALVSMAPCPVVVVPRVPPPRGRIVVGIDGSPASMGAIRFAFTEASVRGAELIAVHAYALPPTHVDLRDRLTEHIRVIEADQRRNVGEALAGWREDNPDVTLEQIFDHRAPVDSLVDYAGEADLVVVGSHGRGASQLFMGSVSEAVVRHANCPVAVIRPSEHQERSRR